MRVWRIILAAFLTTYVHMAGGYDLHIGDVTVPLSNDCSADHNLHVKVGNTELCAPMTTEWSDNSLHVKMNDITYTVCNGSCGGGGGGGGEWVIPETPEDPIVIPNCNWNQTNDKAYLLSDGNQYFDTGVPINSRDNIEVTLQIINGKSVKILGTVGSSCKYDITLNASGGLRFRIGDSTGGGSGTLDPTVAIQKNIIKTENQKIQGNYVYKYYKLNGTSLNSGDRRKICEDNNSTMLVLKNDYTTTNNTQSGGIKLYRIRQWDSSGTLIHDFQPVAAGTNICGTVAATNAMWDTVTKKLYYPAGTGQMGYGVDP